MINSLYVHIFLRCQIFNRRNIFVPLILVVERAIILSIVDRISQVDVVIAF
jgi:hypothetical protein